MTANPSREELVDSARFCCFRFLSIVLAARVFSLYFHMFVFFSNLSNALYIKQRLLLFHFELSLDDTYIRNRVLSLQKMREVGILL